MENIKQVRHPLILTLLTSLLLLYAVAGNAYILIAGALIGILALDQFVYDRHFPKNRNKKLYKLFFCVLFITNMMFIVSFIITQLLLTKVLA